jgi:GT2 family glycosyltransferase
MTRTDHYSVSVVIPCHNYARFLGEAIESVLGQTHRPLEVIVVDDGSVDNTGEVAARYPGVTLLSQPNKGVCAATNDGVRASTGNFIMRLDADDVLAPAYIEEMLDALAHDPEAAFAYADGNYFGEASGPVPLQPFDPEALAEGAYAVCLALMRRSAYERVGGYDLGMTAFRCEDWDMWLSFADLGLHGVLVRKPLWCYRQHGRSRVKQTLSLDGLRREYAQIARLQNNHPVLFGPPSLLRRLVGLPGRVARGQATPRFALLLVSFYAVMLARSGLHLTQRSAGRRTGTG